MSLTRFLRLFLETSEGPLSAQLAKLLGERSSKLPGEESVTLFRVRLGRRLVAELGRVSAAVLGELPVVQFGEQLPKLNV